MRMLYQSWFPEIGPSKARRFNGAEWLRVAAIVALGVALRWWSPAMKSDLWYDEVCSYTVAGRPFGAMMHTLYLGADTNPPLYTILLHFWLKLGASDTHVKVFSLLFATASIWVVYLLAQRLFGRRVGLISSLLFATSQAVITYSVEARPYAMFLFLSLLSTYFLVSAFQIVEPEGPRPSDSQPWLWLSYSVASILTVYTHWFALLVLLLQTAVFIIYRPRSRKIVRAYALSLTVVACCCLPLAPFLWNQVALQGSVGGYSWPGRPGVRSVVNLAAFFVGDKNVLALAGLILAVALFRRTSERGTKGDARRHIIFFVTYLVVPVIVVLTVSNLIGNNSFFVNRYFLPFIVSVPLMIGLALSRLNRKIAFAFALVFVLCPVLKTVKHWRIPETPYSQTASELSIQPRKNVLIAHLSPMSYYPVLHYRRNGGATERILCLKAKGAYETAYNLDGEMLSADDVMEVGPELQKYKDLWVIIDPIDRDKKVGDAYEYIRNHSDFVRESEIQICGLRLEHYTLRALTSTGGVLVEVVEFSNGNALSAGQAVR